MNPLVSAIDYQIFPPINAALNSLSTVLLVAGFFLIKSGRRKAHQYTMTAALVSSALFLACYLTYHYGAGHTEFPKEYPVARRIYLAILIPHIILAVVNLPLIIILVTAAARGRFETHKKFARVTFPSWLFVSVTGVIIYFMIYQWFPATGEGVTPAPAAEESGPRSAGTETSGKSGDLVFTPVTRMVNADPGEKQVEVTFSVKNTGSEAVGITGLESGCECLSVSIDQDPIPPGAVATITGVFNIEQLRGSSEKNISVLTGQQSRPFFLTTRIEIDPIYSIEESMTTWGIDSEPETKVVTFRVLREAPVHVLSAESKRKEVRCDLVEVEKGRLYHLKLTPQSTASSLLGIVRLETDCEIESYARPLAYFSIQ